MEELKEVPANPDTHRLPRQRGPADLGQDGQMAIGESEGGTLRDEPELVPKAGFGLLARFHGCESRTTVRSLIEERLTWPVRAVLLGGGGHYGHFLPD